MRQGSEWRNPRVVLRCSFRCMRGEGHSVGSHRASRPILIISTSDALFAICGPGGAHGTASEVSSGATGRLRQEGCCQVSAANAAHQNRIRLESVDEGVAEVYSKEMRGEAQENIAQIIFSPSSEAPTPEPRRKERGQQKEMMSVSV